MPKKRPGNARNLASRISKYATDHGTTDRRIQRTIANVVVGQMLPPGVVKGGAAIKARVGEPASRFTADFDAARDSDLSLEEFIDQFEDRLAAGWHEFRGTIAAVEPRTPDGVPAEYVMRPYDIALTYRGGSG